MWHKKNNIQLFFFLLCIYPFQIISASEDIVPWDKWKQVGKAELTWGFWKIYDSELYSKSGSYSSHKEPLALLITYNRNVSSNDLLDATLDQWFHLGYSKTQIADWSLKMENAWPDIKEGDKLIYLYETQGKLYYQPQNGSPILYKELKNEKLAKAFIDIWLSPRTAYPNLRKGLLGLEPQ